MEQNKKRRELFVRAVPQFLHWLSDDYFLAFFAPGVGTVWMVCKMRLAIL
jgi:hypothetical protein